MHKLKPCAFARRNDDGRIKQGHDFLQLAGRVPALGRYDVEEPVGVREGEHLYAADGLGITLQHVQNRAPGQPFRRAGPRLKPPRGIERKGKSPDERRQYPLDSGLAGTLSVLADFRRNVLQVAFVDPRQVLVRDRPTINGLEFKDGFGHRPAAAHCYRLGVGRPAKRKQRWK